MYNMNAFSEIIIYVGGNDAASQVHDELFEETNDRLINKIKRANTDCKIYVCKLSLRGDADVNKQTYQYMYGGNGLPLLRYYSDDRIHLSTSGPKRLLDAINTATQIVSDFETCVFTRRYQGNSGGTGRWNMTNGNTPSGMTQNVRSGATGPKRFNWASSGRTGPRRFNGASHHHQF